MLAPLNAGGTKKTHALDGNLKKIMLSKVTLRQQ
jgi:hypothetical protein